MIGKANQYALRPNTYTFVFSSKVFSREGVVRNFRGERRENNGVQPESWCQWLNTA